MIKKFAAGAKRVISASLAAAGELGHTYVGSEHMLLGLISDDGSTPSQLLIDRGCSYGDVRERIIGMVGMGCRSVLTADDMTPVYRRIILRASLISRSSGCVSVGAEHLLMAMLCEECVGTRILENSGVDIDELSETLDSLYGEAPEIEDAEDGPFGYSDPEDEKSPPAQSKKRRLPTPLLDAAALDITERARSGRLDPVICREREEERIISILLRRTKNNPCLIGEAGVGKTAVVESVASRIASGNVPDGLKNKRIMSLELSSLVAGTKYRGEFEEKVKNILDEVRNSDDVILFIDEIHTIVGAGGAEGAIDASNILKPALARGEIRLIGATTLKEYRQSIEKDKALERRFQTVAVREPDPEVCRSMLLGIRGEYESFHGVSISDRAIDSAIELSVRYMPERFLPDKAIDLLDEASATLRSASGKNEIPTVTEDEVAAAVESRTGVPVSFITSDERERLLKLETELRSRVLGQNEAAEKLAASVRRARLGVRAENSPGGSFLFVGPPGVGKTECAKALAESVFGGKKSFLRIDMSEYSEPHSVSKLIGAPPGYVGYGEGGLLTERLRRDPYTLVLFDEADKAHPDVRALFLQILDEGRLTDSCGTPVSFADSIVIVTSNSVSGANIGFGSSKRASDQALSFLPKELLDRFDDVIEFSPLSYENVCRIADIKLQSLAEKMKKRGVKLAFDPGFSHEAIGENAGSARTASRAALRKAEDALSLALLEGRLKSGDEAVIFCEKGDCRLKITQKAY